MPDENEPIEFWIQRPVKRKRFNKGVTWRQYAAARIRFYIKLATIQKQPQLVELDDLKRWQKMMVVKGN